MSWRPTQESSKLLLECQRLLQEYSESISLRQLFYLLANEGLIELNETSYRKVKNLMINARKHGRVSPTTFAFTPKTTPESIYGNAEDYVQHFVDDYRIPRTFNQPNYVEIWVEREPLSVFISSLVEEYDIPVYVTGGYSSFSFVFDAAQRIKEAGSRKGSPRILYFSDFSPASTNMFESQVTEIASHLDLTKEEVEAIMLRVCVEPEHIVKYDLPILEYVKSTQKTVLYEEAYSESLEVLGIEGLPVVEIEAINPHDLSEIVSNSIFSLTDQKVLGSVAFLEAKNRKELRRLTDE